MKGSIRHFFTKTIIIFLIAFVGLPCTLKREIKLGLNIPTISWKDSARQNNTVVCQSFIAENAGKIFVSHQKKGLRDSEYSSQLSRLQPNVLQQLSPVTSGVILFNTVPIYILHEQYLI